MTATSSTNLEVLVKAYVSAEKDYDATRAEYERLSRHSPSIPELCYSLEEAKEYKARLNAHEAEVQTLGRKKTEFSQQIEVLKKQILELLPIKNIWVKAGDYAVGYYYDVWGGGHYDIEIKPWTELAKYEADSLPKLTDRIHYD
jgi:hypothetical protein